ncbi:hypothetical protein Tco_1482877 [Tanacetum coccineum]
MTSITTQQTKLDLELVPKENRLDIRKCNGRIPRRLKPKEETFQVILDALALTPYYPAFLITADVINSLNDVVIDQMHQPWRTFAAIINRSLSGKTSGLDKLRLSRAQILWACEVPPKVSRKFKKASPSKKESELVPGDEEPVKRAKRLKTHCQTKSKNEKLKDFHKTHPSGSGMVFEKPPSVEKITPTVTSEGTGDKPGVPDVTNDDSSESESESWGNDEDDSNNEQESSDETVSPPPTPTPQQENESEEQELDSEQDEESDDDDQEQEDFDHEN